MKALSSFNKRKREWKWFQMGFQLNRINPNQTQVFFVDGRFETMTDQELEDFLSQISLSEINEDKNENLMH